MYPYSWVEVDATIGHVATQPVRTSKIRFIRIFGELKLNTIIMLNELFTLITHNQHSRSLRRYRNTQRDDFTCN